MIISRTPFRLSFFGGGTDYPEWFETNPGAVLATTFDKYGYIFCQPTSSFVDYKYRISYRLTEIVNDRRDIQHPAVRAALGQLGIEFGVELDYHGDLLARSGIGSSSAFCVGLLDVFYHLIGQPKSKAHIAREAINLERNVLREVVGVQDQYSCAIGGINFLEFNSNNTVSITPIVLDDSKIDEIQNRIVLVYSGLQRDSSQVSQTLLEDMSQNEKRFVSNYEMAVRAKAILETGQDLDEFGDMLRVAWDLKAKMNRNSVTGELDEIYQVALSRGALGGKVLGAGGGGFMMFWIPADTRERFISEMSQFTIIPISLETEGTKILYSDAPVTRTPI